MIGMHGVSLYSAVRRSRMSDSMPIRTDATDDVDRAAATMWAAAGRVAMRAPTKARRAVTAADARTAERTRVDATMNAMMAVGVEEPQAVCNRGGSTAMPRSSAQKRRHGDGIWRGRGGRA